VAYFDVKSDIKHIETMLTWSKGDRHIPVIVENGIVAIGFDGKS